MLLEALQQYHHGPRLTVDGRRLTGAESVATSGLAAVATSLSFYTPNHLILFR
jgi:hypothetical protein